MHFGERGQEKERHIHMTEYYLVFEESEILSFMTTWMNLEDIKHNKAAQSNT